MSHFLLNTCTIVDRWQYLYTILMQIALVLVRLGALTHKGEIETTTNCGLGIDLVVSQTESTFLIIKTEVS